MLCLRHCDMLFSLSMNSVPTPVYPLSLHDALPIYDFRGNSGARQVDQILRCELGPIQGRGRADIENGARTLAQRSAPDRKSTRLNSSHLGISYAVFCLKKKKNKKYNKTNPYHTPRT